MPRTELDVLMERVMDGGDGVLSAGYDRVAIDCLRMMPSIYAQIKQLEADLAASRASEARMKSVLNELRPSQRAPGCWCPNEHNVYEYGHKLKCLASNAAMSGAGSDKWLEAQRKIAAAEALEEIAREASRPAFIVNDKGFGRSVMGLSVANVETRAEQLRAGAEALSKEPKDAK